MKHECYLANWTFYKKQSAKEKDKKLAVITHTIEGVITPHIPLRFLLNEGIAYKRATRGAVIQSMMSELENDKITGLKKFTVTYTKKIQGLQ